LSSLLRPGKEEGEGNDEEGGKVKREGDEVKGRVGDDRVLTLGFNSFAVVCVAAPLVTAVDTSSLPPPPPPLSPGKDGAGNRNSNSKHHQLKQLKRLNLEEEERLHCKLNAWAPALEDHVSWVEQKQTRQPPKQRKHSQKQAHQRPSSSKEEGGEEGTPGLLPVPAVVVCGGLAVAPVPKLDAHPRFLNDTQLEADQGKKTQTLFQRQASTDVGGGYGGYGGVSVGECEAHSSWLERRELVDAFRFHAGSVEGAFTWWPVPTSAAQANHDNASAEGADDSDAMIESSSSSSSFPKGEATSSKAKKAKKKGLLALRKECQEQEEEAEARRKAVRAENVGLRVDGFVCSAALFPYGDDDDEGKGGDDEGSQSVGDKKKMMKGVVSRQGKSKEGRQRRRQGAE